MDGSNTYDRVIVAPGEQAQSMTAAAALSGRINGDRLGQFASLCVGCHRIEVTARRFRRHSLRAVTTGIADRLANTVRRRREQLFDCTCMFSGTKLVYGDLENAVMRLNGARKERTIDEFATPKGRSGQSGERARECRSLTHLNAVRATSRGVQP
jgi:hypothetical protein